MLICICIRSIFDNNCNNNKMHSEDVVSYISEHIKEYHREHKGRCNILYVYDNNEYEQILQEVEDNHDHLEEYVDELNRLECLLGDDMTDELKEEYLKVFDNMYDDRTTVYRSIVRSIISSTAHCINFVVFGTEDLTERVTKIIFDRRTDNFVVNDIYPTE